MPLSHPRHPEHCGCAGIPLSWKLPIPLGAAVDINLAGLEGLVPELCPSAVLGLPQDLLQGVEGRGLWPSAGPISIGSYGALPPAAGHGHLCSCSKHSWRQEQEWEQMGKRGESRREKQAGKKGRSGSVGGMAPHQGRQRPPCSPEALAPAAPSHSQLPQPSPWVPTFPSPGSTRLGTVGRVLSRACGSVLEQ